MNKIYKILLDDNKWYKLPTTVGLFSRSQQSIVDQILEYEKQTYNGIYKLNNQWVLNINGFGKGLRAYIENINIKYGGFCTNDGNEIFLNRRFCRLVNNLSKNSEEYKKMCHNEEERDYWEFVYNNPYFGGAKGIYQFLAHELHHAFQKYLIKNKNEIIQQVDDRDKPALTKYINQLEAYMYEKKYRN